MWFAADAFQFVWKKISGDVTLTADISFAEHRRQSAQESRADGSAESGRGFRLCRRGAARQRSDRHCNFAMKKADDTREIQSNHFRTQAVRIAKRGDYVYMALAADAGASRRWPADGCACRCKERSMSGIGVCSHDKDVSEKAVFSNVDLATPPSTSTGKPTLYSTLETVASRIRRPARDLHRARTLRSAELDSRRHRPSSSTATATSSACRWPAASPRSSTPVSPIAATTITAFRPTARSLPSATSRRKSIDSLVYIVPIGGGTPRRITKNSPSYWHGWSPDGKTLAFVGQRNGEFDIYTIPAAGGEETRLTTAKGLDDGPEYSPDGNYIYFNSERTGTMQIWRMRADGSQQEQVTSDEFNNWFPHISPDGKWMVFLSYDKSVTGHPENKDVVLRLMPYRRYAKENQGAGPTLWRAGDHQRSFLVAGQQELAFVSYQLIPEDGATK